MDLDLEVYEREAHDAGYMCVAGVDEAGRGPLAGPVVAAAVILPEGFDLSGIRDSKAISEAQRKASYERILASAIVGVGIIDSETIDRINILQATFEAMRTALKDMGKPYDFVLVDGDKTIPKLETPQKAIIDGDALSVSIAAASIVAKVTRDCIMVELAETYPHYGFDKHKGYCTKAHLAAIEEHGVCSVHRRSFAPISRKVKTNCPQRNLF